MNVMMIRGGGSGGDVNGRLLLRVVVLLSSVASPVLGGGECCCVSPSIHYTTSSVASWSMSCYDGLRTCIRTCTRVDIQCEVESAVFVWRIEHRPPCLLLCRACVSIGVCLRVRVRACVVCCCFHHVAVSLDLYWGSSPCSGSANGGSVYAVSSCGTMPFTTSPSACDAFNGTLPDGSDLFSGGLVMSCEWSDGPWWYWGIPVGMICLLVALVIGCCSRRARCNAARQSTTRRAATAAAQRPRVATYVTSAELTATVVTAPISQEEAAAIPQAVAVSAAASTVTE